MYQRCMPVSQLQGGKCHGKCRADHSRWCPGSVYELNTLVGGSGNPYTSYTGTEVNRAHGPARLRSVRSTDSGAWVQNGLAGDQRRVRKGCTLTMGLKQTTQGLKIPLGHRCGYSGFRSAARAPTTAPHTTDRSVHVVRERFMRAAAREEARAEACTSAYMPSSRPAMLLQELGQQRRHPHRPTVARDPRGDPEYSSRFAVGEKFMYTLYWRARAVRVSSVAHVRPIRRESNEIRGPTRWRAAQRFSAKRRVARSPTLAERVARRVMSTYGCPCGIQPCGNKKMMDAYSGQFECNSCACCTIDVQPPCCGTLTCCRCATFKCYGCPWKSILVLDCDPDYMPRSLVGNMCEPFYVRDENTIVYCFCHVATRVGSPGVKGGPDSHHMER